MDRLQAMATLKELVARDLVEPSYISMANVKHDKFQIQLKCDYKKVEIEEFKKNMV